MGAFARSTESTTIGYALDFVYRTGREAGIGRDTGQDGFGSSTGSTAGETTSVATGSQSRSSTGESTYGVASFASGFATFARSKATKGSASSSVALAGWHSHLCCFFIWWINSVNRIKKLWLSNWLCNSK